MRAYKTLKGLKTNVITYQCDSCKASDIDPAIRVFIRSNLINGSAYEICKDCLEKLKAVWGKGRDLIAP